MIRTVQSGANEKDALMKSREVKGCLVEERETLHVKTKHKMPSLLSPTVTTARCLWENKRGTFFYDRETTFIGNVGTI